MPYTLPALPYAANALEPHIDARTMEIHHGKHHQAYITNANNLLKDHPALDALDVNALIADLSKVPEAIRGGVRNNAGGHSNHSFFWKILAPGKGGAPKGTLAAAIDAQLGGLAKFKEDFA
ncbi:MAG: superoxide dismutase, partial [Verrucomicrobiota bacterium]